MNISKYRLTENDVQEMVMSTAKRILENKQLLEGVVNEMGEGKSSINEDTYYGTPGYITPGRSIPPSFFGGERNYVPQMPPYGYMPMMPPYGYMPRPPMGPPPTRPGNGLLRYLLFRNYINNHINALGDYYHGAGGTHESPIAPSAGGGGRSGSRGGGYGGGRGGSRRGGASAPSGTSGSTSDGTDGASGGTGGTGSSSGGTANTTTVKEIPPTAPVVPSPINVPTPDKPITPPTRREPVIGGGGGGSNINRSGSHDNIIHGSHNQISNDDHSSRVDNSVQNHKNSHNTTTNINQTQNYDQRSSVNNNNVHIGGDRIIGNRRGGGRPPISRPIDHGHDHGPRRDFGGNGGGMRHRGHGGYDSDRGGRRPRI